ncbi:MAG: SpoVA/SpoVAEb family sporulation membrane protein [Firmicutes bacterium]|jgi:stage V sporulation protein AC|nr:SpoVA/SpoVAEb family sporulation membrane protein [Bacillota bacterium]
MDPKRYRQLVRERLPKPDLARGVTRAFVLGGTIALLGQVVYDIFRAMEPTQGEAVAATLATLILIGGVLTALGVYDNLAEWGGAGAAVPITGFANTIVSAAMDFRREGIVLGLASKMFVIAGPVIVFATVVGLIVGLAKAIYLGLFA